MYPYYECVLNMRQHIPRERMCILSLREFILTVRECMLPNEKVYPDYERMYSDYEREREYADCKTVSSDTVRYKVE